MYADCNWTSRAKDMSSVNRSAVKDGSSGAICRAFNLFENRLHLVIPLNSLFSAGKAGDRGREGAVSKAGSDG